MPELDGFELAAMIREHPRFQKTAMIFISAIQVSDIDRLRGYEQAGVGLMLLQFSPQREEMARFGRDVISRWRA